MVDVSEPMKNEDVDLVNAVSLGKNSNVCHRYLERTPFGDYLERTPLVNIWKEHLW